jgi:hypothetical protein
MLNGLQGQRPLFIREKTHWGWVTFDQTLNQSLRAGTPTFDPNSAMQSKIWHEGLPLDYAREEGPLASLLELALKTAGVSAADQDHPATHRILKSSKSHLVGVVNESPVEAARTFSGESYRIDLSAMPGRSSLRLVDAATGKTLAAYEPPDVD